MLFEAPIAAAFAAGLVATVNPCGFAMLPAYLSYFMGTDTTETSRAGALRRALVVGGLLSIGFLLVFGSVGVVYSLGFRAITRWIPWLALIVGVLVALLGVATLGGYELTVRLPKAKRAVRMDTTHKSMFAFGVSYAVASLSCTLPVFIAVVATNLTNSSLVSGVATFIAYGLGMSLLLMAITIGLALGRRSLVGWLRRSARYLNRAAGVILVLAGAYIVWFWSSNLSNPTGATNNGAFRFVDSVSQWFTDLIGSNAIAVGIGLGTLVVGILTHGLFRERTRPDTQPAD